MFDDELSMLSTVSEFILVGKDCTTNFKGSFQHGGSNYEYNLFSVRKDL